MTHHSEPTTTDETDSIGFRVRRRDLPHFCLMPTSLRDNAGCGRNEIAAYYVLATYADSEDASAYPNVATVAEAMQCSERTAKTALANLVATGYVERVARGKPGGGRTSNMYYIRMTPAETGEIRQKTAPPSPSEPTPAVPVPESVSATPQAIYEAAMQVAGYRNQIKPSTVTLSMLQRCLRKGASAADLVAIAEQSGRADNPKAWIEAAWRRIASEAKPRRPKPRRGAWGKDPACANCDADGWVTIDDGLQRCACWSPREQDPAPPGVPTPDLNSPGPFYFPADQPVVQPPDERDDYDQWPTTDPHARSGQGMHGNDGPPRPHH